jgi:hypothetical protein
MFLKWTPLGRAIRATTGAAENWRDRLSGIFCVFRMPVTVVVG